MLSGTHSFISTLAFFYFYLPLFLRKNKKGIGWWEMTDQEHMENSSYRHSENKNKSKTVSELPERGAQIPGAETKQEPETRVVVT